MVFGGFGGLSDSVGCAMVDSKKKHLPTAFLLVQEQQTTDWLYIQWTTNTFSFLFNLQKKNPGRFFSSMSYLNKTITTMVLLSFYLYVQNLSL